MTLISRHFSDDSFSTYLKKILICPVSLSMASQNSEHLASLCSVNFLRYQSHIFFAVSALSNPLPPLLLSLHFVQSHVDFVTSMILIKMSSNIGS